jgi:hypothetical protein
LLVEWVIQVNITSIINQLWEKVFHQHRFLGFSHKLCPEPTNDRGQEDGRETRFTLASALYPKRGAGSEQQKKKKATSEEMASILDCYVNRWQRWAAAGLQGITIDIEGNLAVTISYYYP